MRIGGGASKKSFPHCPPFRACSPTSSGAPASPTLTRPFRSVLPFQAVVISGRASNLGDACLVVAEAWWLPGCCVRFPHVVAVVRATLYAAPVKGRNNGGEDERPKTVSYYCSPNGLCEFGCVIQNPPALRDASDVQETPYRPSANILFARRRT